MRLRPISGGSVATGASPVTLQCGTGVFGGCLITTDGTNAATITVRDDDASGKILFEMSTVSAGPVHAPYKMKGPGSLYCTIAGTGAEAMFYEWMD